MTPLAERLLSLAVTQINLARETTNERERTRLAKEARFHHQWAIREINAEKEKAQEFSQ